MVDIIPIAQYFVSSDGVDLHCWCSWSALTSSNACQAYILVLRSKVTTKLLRSMGRGQI